MEGMGGKCGGEGKMRGVKKGRGREELRRRKVRVQNSREGHDDRHTPPLLQPLIHPAFLLSVTFQIEKM